MPCRLVARLRVGDRLDRLRHDAVVRRHHQYDHVRQVRPARPHRRERLVPRRIDERHVPVALVDPVRTDVLRDAACFARRHVRTADRIQQRRLAVVDVPHHRHHRRPRQQILPFARRKLVLQTLVSRPRLLNRQRNPQLHRQQFRLLRVD